jgi:hypothetical protein
VTRVGIARSVVRTSYVNRSNLLTASVFAVLTVCLAAAESAVRAAERPITAVPALAGKSLPGAYAELHRDGFRVSFIRAFSLDWSGECVPVVTSSAPGSGRRVPRAVTIVLSTRRLLCGAASPAVPVPLPGPYRVPSFSGKPLSVAIGWVKARHLLWSATIPALRDGDAATLYANYVITSQKPKPGTKLTVGVRSDGGWQPTPLQLVVRSR